MNFLNFYKRNIVNYDLINKFSYTNPTNLPKIKQINVYFIFKTPDISNTLTGLNALELLSQQKGVLIKSKTANISLKIRKGSPVGCMVILRKNKKDRFLNKLLNDIFGKKYRIDYDASFKHFIFSFNIKSTLLFNELKQNYRFFGRLPFLRINLLTTAKTKNEFKFLIKSYKLIN